MIRTHIIDYSCAADAATAATVVWVGATTHALLAFIAIVVLGDNTSTTVRRVRTSLLAFIAIVLLGGKEVDEHSC